MTVAGEPVTYYGSNVERIVTVDGGPVSLGSIVYYRGYPEDTEGVVVRMCPDDFGSVTVLWSVWRTDVFEFPTIRKAFNYPKIANDLVSIQPMSLPAGSIFYLDYQYGSGSKDGD